MAIRKAEIKKEYALESQSLIRVLASGLKLTTAVMKNMGLKAGVAQEKDKETKAVVVEGKPGDYIHFAQDDEANKLYLYKAAEGAGSVIGSTKSFTNTALKMELMKRASGSPIVNGEGVVAIDTPIKNNLQIRFSVSETPVNEGGVDFYEVTFKEAIVAEKGSDDDADDTSDAPAETAVKQGNGNW